MSETGTQILDLAERRMRQRGYHAVSFRDLADELGIKSASIHYHFRQKQDLGAAVVERYAERIATTLGDPSELAWPEALKRFCAVYKSALKQQKLQCLCGMFAAECHGLPSVVAERVSDYFRANLDWLVAAMPETMLGKKTKALRIQSELQGAMTVAVSLSDYGMLDKAAREIIEQY